LEENSMIALSDVRARADRLRMRANWRNIALYAYSAANIGLSLWLIASGRLSSFKYPMVLMIAAHVFVLWQVNRRIASRALPGEMAGQAALDFLRDELERQAGAFSNAWLWYIAPFMPAFLWELAIAFHRLQLKAAETGHPSDYRLLMFTILTAICFWTAVWLAFSRGAVKFQLQVERLNALKAE
jgi:hypothetical protein